MKLEHQALMMKQRSKQPGALYLAICYVIALIMGGLATNGFFWLFQSYGIKPIAMVVFTSGFLGSYFTLLIVVLADAVFKKKDDKKGM